MPRFKYKAKTLEGRTVEAVAEAPDDVVLEKDLRAQGLVLITSMPAEKKRAGAGSSAGVALGQSDLIFFTMEVGTSYAAGLPLLQTLEDMAQSAETRAVREISRGICERVRGGSTLADALASFPKAFPSLYVELVAAAERTGKLEVILEDLVKFLEWQKETRGQIVSATVYPVSMMGAVVGLGLVLTLFVFPRFLATFAAMGGDLPLPTKILLWVDSTFKTYKVAILATTAALPFVYVAVRNIPPVRWYIDLAKLRMPIIGPLLTKLLMSLFAHNLGMMIGSGLDFSSALKLCERLMGNVVFASLVADARVAVEGGRPLSDAMSKGRLVPSLVRRMLKLGESTGEMESSLENVSRYYDKEIPRSIKRMFSILEPLILVVMAGVVLFMASAVMLPLYGMLNKMGQQ